MEAGPLQHVVTAIEEKSSDPASLKELLTMLASHEELLIKHMPQLDDLLPVLNPTAHTLGMVYILNCKSAAVPLSNLQAVNVFLRQCRRMLLGCDPEQVQLVPAQFVAVCVKFASAAVAVKSPLWAVRPLHAAACALQPSPAHFTPLHAEFLKLCLLSKCYSAARPLLEQELLQVDKDATAVTPRDLLLYHYYAGMVEIGCKRYKAATQYLTLCFSAPSHVLNAIMVEAYKKCLLASLIDVGEAPRMPKYTAPVVQRQIKSHALAPYTEIAEAFATHKPSELASVIDKHAAVLSADHNLGLAKQCGPALKRRQILRLTRSYLTLSLQHIATTADLADATEAEKYVVDMVGAGEICASIDQPQGMVHFHERQDRFDSQAAVGTMEDAIARALALAKKLQETNAQLATDQNYLSRIASQERQPRWEDDAAALAK